MSLLQNSAAKGISWLRGAEGEGPGPSVGKIAYPHEEQKGPVNESVTRGIIAILAKHSRVAIALVAGGIGGTDGEEATVGRDAGVGAARRAHQRVVGVGGEAAVLERGALARAFVAKVLYNMPTTRVLLDRLESDEKVRRICGWERKSDSPSESTFSRAFAEFAEEAVTRACAWRR